MYQEENIYIAGGGRRIPVTEMTTSHLLTAFTSLAEREFETYQQMCDLLAKIDRVQSELSSKINRFQQVKDMLSKEMEKRRITPIYPDQKYIGSSIKRNYGIYFSAERKTKAMEPVQKAVLSTDRSLSA